MKYMFALSIIFFSGIYAFSQDFMDTIVKGTCECLDEVSDTLSVTSFNMELGLCMINAAMPFQKEILDEYGINLENIDTEAENFGRIIGLKMVAVCPNSLKRVTRKNTVDEEEDELEPSIEGEIVKIDKEQFVVFSLKDERGRRYKFYWLSFIDSDMELTETYTDFIGKTATIIYSNFDFFDPKIEEYRQFKVIKTFTILNNN